MIFRVSDTVGAALSLDDRAVLIEMKLDVEPKRGGFNVSLPDIETAQRFLDELDFRGSGGFDIGSGELRACRAAAKRLRKEWPRV